MSVDMEQAFAEYVKQKEDEEKLKKGKGASFKREYETIKWAGLEHNVPKIVRCIGGPPDENLSPYDARSIILSRIVDDEGRIMKVVRYKDDTNNIIQRIINTVQRVKYVNGEKTFPVKEKFPELFNLIEKNGLDEKDKRYRYDKGWVGKPLYIINVIDRSEIDWCKENKHTMLLAKSVALSPEGAEFVDEGISSAATEKRLRHLFSSYGPWEGYDLAITKTGDKENPYIISNASEVPKEVDASVRGFISQEKQLTDEEKSWEKYDISRLYGKTTNTKIYNRLKNTIKRIDASLGTSFIEDLQAEVEKEKKLFEEIYGTKEEGDNADDYIPTPKEETSSIESTPIKETRTRTKSGGEEWAKLPYGNTLSDEMKKKVKNVEKDEEGHYVIDWDVPISDLLGCPEENCKVPSPASLSRCPCCGLEF